MSSAWHRRERLYRQAAAPARGRPLRPGQGPLRRRHPVCRARRGASSCAARTRMRASARSTPSAASRMPGVLLTLTAADWDKAGHGELTVVHPMPFGDGRPMNCAPRPAFAREQGASRRRHRRGGDRPRRALPPRMRPRPWRSITSRCPRSTTTRDAVAAGAPLVHPRVRQQPGVRDRARPPRQDRSGAGRRRQGRRAAASPTAGSSANPMEPRAYLCDYDAAARPLHALRDEPAAALPAPLALGLHAAHSRAQNPRGLAGRRRRLRRQRHFRRPRCRPWSGPRSSCAGR